MADLPTLLFSAHFMDDDLSDRLDCVSLECVETPAAVDMPLELLDLIVLAGGWRGWFTWRAVSWRWCELPEPLRKHVCIVPDDHVTILRGISNAPANESGGGPVVLVRPGTYAESVRVLRDVTLVGLGEVVVRAPGWESALVWGGYTVRGVKLFHHFELQSSNAGAGARVHNLTLCQRNQRQATAVCTPLPSPVRPSNPATPDVCVAACGRLHLGHAAADSLPHRGHRARGGPRRRADRAPLLDRGLARRGLASRRPCRRQV